MSYPEDFDNLIISSKEEFARLQPQARTAYCIHRLEAEVNNGGFYQYFTNSTGEYVLETIQALTDIRAMKTCKLLKRAVAFGFPSGYPANASDYEIAVADFDDVADDLNALNQEFFMYVEPLSDLVNTYLTNGI